MIKITLKDDSILEVEKGTSIYEVAQKISEGLARGATCATVNGKVQDLRYKLNEDCNLNIETFEGSGEGKKAYWHTTSHIMAQAVKRLFPNVKFAIGPAIEEGFYYDFDVEKPFTDEDKEKIEQEKLEILKKELSELGSAAVAFSGGVDSAFLLKTAHDVLGNRVAAITIRSRIFPGREISEAEQFCRQYGIRQIICEVDELSIEGFSHNPHNRCYLCKRRMMEQVMKAAQAEHLAYIVEGSNLDDDGDYRPGHQAVAELGIKSPLREAGLSKAQIRSLSRQMGLPTWDKPSFACLASRFVYGETITPEKLSMVEKGEQLLLDLGFYQVRVRIHGLMARIEVLPQDFEQLLQEDLRQHIVNQFLEYGFTHVSLDLLGYRTGSMNKGIEADSKTA